MTTRRALAVGVLILLGGAGCGVPSDDSPSPVADADLPASLRAAATPTTVATSRPATDAIAIYLIRDDELVRLNEFAAGRDIDAVLDVLQRGPSAARSKAGYRSAFTDTELIRDARLEGATAVIDLDTSFVDVPHQDQILALGQLVLTATDLQGVEAVRLTVDGEELQVPTSDGTLTNGSLTRADYAPLLSR